MSLPHPILIASDLSEASEIAAERAFLLAAETQAPVVVLHVIPDAFGDLALEEERGTPISEQSPEVRRFRVGLHLTEQRLARIAGLASTPARTITVKGSTHAQILRIAQRESASLIVLGRNESRPTMKRILLGDTTERVLRATRRPVLIVRRRARGAHENVLVPTDATEVTGAVLQAVHSFAPRARIHVLHLADIPLPGSSELARIRAALESRLSRWRMEADLDPASLTLEVAKGEPGTGIVAAAERHSHDLIAMATRRQGLSRALLGSTTELVIRAAATDVLAVPP